MRSYRTCASQALCVRAMDNCHRLHRSFPPRALTSRAQSCTWLHGRTVVVPSPPCDSMSAHAARVCMPLRRVLDARDVSVHVHHYVCAPVHLVHARPPLHTPCQIIAAVAYTRLCALIQGYAVCAGSHSRGSLSMRADTARAPMPAVYFPTKVVRARASIHFSA